MSNKKPFWLQAEEESKAISKTSRETLRKHLLKIYKFSIHYNYSEPKKFGVNYYEDMKNSPTKDEMKK